MEDPRPDPLNEDAGQTRVQAALRRAFLPALTALFVAAFTIYRLNVADAVFRPFILTLGRPASAVVSAKRVSHSKYSAGNYLELNYQYSEDYAPRPEVRVNNDAYQAVELNSKVPIHYLPGLPSFVALDFDFGSSLEQGLMGLIVGGAVGLAFFVSKPRRGV